MRHSGIQALGTACLSFSAACTLPAPWNLFCICQISRKLLHQVQLELATGINPLVAHRAEVRDHLSLGYGSIVDQKM